MVPAWLQNGTDLRGRAARRRRAARGASRRPSGRARCWCWSPTARSVTLSTARRSIARSPPLPGLELELAALTIRAVDDEPAATARAGRLARARRGPRRRGARAARERDRRRRPDAAGRSARGAAIWARSVSSPTATSDASRRRCHPAGRWAAWSRSRDARRARSRIEAIARGQRMPSRQPRRRVAPEWLRPWVARRRVADRPVSERPLPGGDGRARPALRRRHLRATRSRARWTGWSSATCSRWPTCRARAPATSIAPPPRPRMRDLTGKVRLAIDLTRGEVDRATIESSTLGNPGIERCLQESAFEIEVPRAARSDAPVTAVLNMVFRPRTTEKKADVDLGAVGDRDRSGHRRDAPARGQRPGDACATGAVGRPVTSGRERPPPGGQHLDLAAGDPPVRRPACANSAQAGESATSPRSAIRRPRLRRSQGRVVAADGRLRAEDLLDADLPLEAAASRRFEVDHRARVGRVREAAPAPVRPRRWRCIRARTPPADRRTSAASRRRRTTTAAAAPIEFVRAAVSRPRGRSGRVRPGATLRRRRRCRSPRRPARRPAPVRRSRHARARRSPLTPEPTALARRAEPRVSNRSRTCSSA